MNLPDYLTDIDWHQMCKTAIMQLGYRGFHETPRDHSDFMDTLLNVNVISYKFNGPSVNRMMWKQYRHILICAARQADLVKLVKSHISGTTGFKWYFITVGYDDANITVDNIRKYSQKVAMLPQFEMPVYVNEKFRKNDKGEIYIHHHTHFLVKCELSKSKVIQYVYQAVKKVVAGPNFVDVKSYKDNVGSYEQKLAYIQGEKKQEKLECVDLDRTWRIDNDL